MLSEKRSTKAPVPVLAVFVFYKIANGAQARLAFSDEFKHCNVITYDGRDWIMLDFDRTGLLTRRLRCDNADRLLRSLRVVQEVSAVVCVDIADRTKTMWKPWWVRSCNEVSRYACGINIGFTFNPIHLYRKLLKYNGKTNYEILSAWRRKDGILK